MRFRKLFKKLILFRRYKIFLKYMSYIQKQIWLTRGSTAIRPVIESKDPSLVKNFLT